MTAGILPHPDGFLIVGTGVSDAYAADCGANVAPDEAAVLLPQAVMDAHVKPLRDRIAELEQQLDEARSEKQYLIRQYEGFVEAARAVMVARGWQLGGAERERDEARAIARNVATALTTYGREVEGVAELDLLLVAWGNWPGDPLPDWLTAEQQPAAGPHHGDTNEIED